MKKIWLRLKTWFRDEKNETLIVPEKQETPSLLAQNLDVEQLFCEIRGNKIAYLKQGNDEKCIVLVHGLGSEATHWQKNMAFLAENHTVFAIDLLGYGNSKHIDFSPREGMVHFFAELVADFIRNVCKKNVFLIGHSMGGQISMLVASNYPKLIEKLILIAPAGIETYSTTQSQLMKHILAFYPTLGKRPSAIRMGFKQNFYKMPDDAEPLILERIAIAESDYYDVYSKLITKCIRAILSTKIHYRQITQKTLVIFGENDRLIPNPVFNPLLKPIHIADKAGKILPNAQVRMIPKAGHFIQFEKSAEVNALIEHFLML